jgi:hypothetical protein
MNLRMDFLKRISFFLFLSFSFALFCFGGENYSLEEALKVLKAIERIKAETASKSKSTLRKIAITESELNSYIAYRIETEKEEVTKEIRLKLLERNEIEGKIVIDLRNQEIPKFLKPLMNFYFAGKLEVEGGKIRLNIKKLFLENQPIHPMVLDLIIYISAKIEKTEASSISDWYEFPYGIDNIETHPGWVAIFY